MSAELLEVVDELGQTIGSATRAACHSDPSIIHRTVGVLVYNEDGQLFIQERASAKDTFPGHLDISASGHVCAGEQTLAAAHRELEEELGIDAPLKHLGSILVRDTSESEYAEIYRCIYGGEMMLNEQEVTDGAFVDPVTIAADEPRLTPFARAVLDAFPTPLTTV